MTRRNPMTPTGTSVLVILAFVVLGILARGVWA